MAWMNREARHPALWMALGALVLIIGPACGDDETPDVSQQPCLGVCPPAQCVFGMCMDAPMEPDMEPDMEPEMEPDMDAGEPDPTPDASPDPNPEPTPDVMEMDVPEVCEDDDLGDNDTCDDVSATPAELERNAETTIDAVICDGDVDHFSLLMSEGEVLFVSLLQAGGAIGFELLDANCGDVIGEGEEAGGGLELTFTAPTDGVYTLNVFADPEGDAGEYELNLTLGDAPPVCEEDGLEPNNDEGTASVVNVPRNSAAEVPDVIICPADVDWFAVQIDNAGDTIAADLEQGQLDEALTVAIIGIDGTTVLDSGEGSAEVEVGGTGRYFVRVSSGEPVPTTGSSYALTIGVSEPEQCDADGFEPNDDTGALISEGTHSGNFCPEGDRDLYRFNVTAGDTLNITLNYDHGFDGDLPVGAVYGPGGFNDLRSALIRDGNTDNDILIEPDLEIDESGEWIVELANGGLELDYTLNLSIEGEMIEQCGVVDDNEPNDTCESAPPLPPFQDVDGFFCGPAEFADDGGDWFRIVVGEGQSADILVEFFHFQGNLDAILYEPDCSTVVDLGFSTNDDEVIEVGPLSAGEYRLRIFGSSSLTENDYVVSVEIN